METNIALLGLSGSGKTTFINEFPKDINCFSPKLSVENVEMTKKAVDSYSYRVKVEGNSHILVKMVDYNGTILKSREEEAAENIKASQLNADMWIVFIDGELLAGETREECVQTLKRKSARTLIPYFLDYQETNGKLPNCCFFISKGGLLSGKFAKEEIKAEIQEAFEIVLTKEQEPLIILSETTTRSSGLFFLSIMYICLGKKIIDEMEKARLKNIEIDQQINQLRASINKIESTLIMKKLPSNQEKLSSYRLQIQKLNQEKNANTALAQSSNDSTLQKYLGIAIGQLMLYHDGQLINGFDKVKYSYDKTMNLLYDHLVLWCYIGFLLDIIIAIGMIVKFGFNIWAVLCYIIIFFLLLRIGGKLDNMRSAKIQKNKRYIYRDELVRFFDDAAKIPKNKE